MPVTAAAVCPHPPLLIPELSTGAAADLDDLRAACLTAIDHLSNATHIVVIGSTASSAGPGTRPGATPAPGSSAAAPAGSSAPADSSTAVPASAASSARPGTRPGATPAPSAAAPAGSSAPADGSTDVPASAASSDGPRTGSGSGLPSLTYDAAAGGGFGAYGAPQVRIGSGPAVLPLALAVGGWLLEQTKAAGLPRTYRAVAVDAAPADCIQLGREIADSNERIGLLVMGDGSPRRSEHSPVHLHPRAEIFDTTVANAFQHKDLDVLKALDPDLATELQAAGRAPWQVLAGALENTALNGDLTYEAAPYGVGYFVASFT